MSVTFYVSGESPDYEASVPNYLNLANANAADLLRWLGFEVDEDLSGLLAPGDLRARCEQRLTSTPANVSQDLPRATIQRENVVQCGRAAGYLRARTAELLALALRAGDRVIEYS